MAKTVCAACGETGGRFRWRGDKYYHVPACAPVTAGDRARDVCKSTFPFVANHVQTPSEGGPMEIKSMRHLRQVENQMGIAADVYSNDHGPSGERY
jgi:hypothetical protein